MNLSCLQDLEAGALKTAPRVQGAESSRHVITELWNIHNAGGERCHRTTSKQEEAADGAGGRREI